MFIAALCMLVKKVGTTQMSIDWLIKKIRYNHTIDYYSVIKRNEVLMHATTWMNLENMLLSDRSPDTKGHIVYNSVLRLNFQHMEEEREGRLPTQHQAIFRHQQGILQFNLILALSTQRQRQLPQVVGSVLPGCSHHFTYQSKPQVVTCSLTDWI